MVTAAIVLVAARFAARRPATVLAGAGMDTLSRLFHWFLALFFLPALALRYGLGFGAPILSTVASVVLIVVAFVRSAREAVSAVRTRALLAQMHVTVGAGIAGMYVGFAFTRGSLELRLLVGAAVSFGAAIVTCGALDRVRAQRSAPGARTDRPADDAA